MARVPLPLARPRRLLPLEDRKREPLPRLVAPAPTRLLPEDPLLAPRHRQGSLSPVRLPRQAHRSRSNREPRIADVEPTSAILSAAHP